MEYFFKVSTKYKAHAWEEPHDLALGAGVYIFDYRFYF